MNGFCDLVIMGSNFPRRGPNRFQELALLVKGYLLGREPFATRTLEIRWHIIDSQQDLNLQYGGYIGSEALSFSKTTVSKIKKVLRDTPMNSMLILDWKEGGGGANGQIAAVGLGQASDAGAQCAFNSRALDGIAIHEWGHSMGVGHDFTDPNNVMWYATNGGCEIAGKPFTSDAQDILSQFIDAAKAT